MPLKHLILYCLVACAATSFSQSDTLNLYQAYPGFSNQQKAEWVGFENNWNFDQYPRLLAKAGMKRLTCKDCGSFYADIYLEVDDQGKIGKAVCTGSWQCGKNMSEALSKSFEGSVLHTTFRFVKNRSFIARFGHILKC